MPVPDQISSYVRRLPEELQAEVLDFVQFLLAKAAREDLLRERREWSQLSLSLAMRGMEDEEGPEYSVADLKEKFS